jgi:hypothetical protein
MTQYFLPPPRSLLLFSFGSLGFLLLAILFIAQSCFLLHSITRMRYEDECDDQDKKGNLNKN